jgi:methyl-accepting chemotaxis protein
MSKKFLRKKLFVNSFAQGRTVAHVAFYWGVYHLILWHVMFLYRYFQYRGELVAGAAPRTFNELYSEFTLTHFSIIVCGLAILPLVIWDVIKFTHRIVGPLVRLQNCLGQLARGEKVVELRFRKGDLLVDLQNAFNAFLESPYCRGTGDREQNFAGESMVRAEAASDGELIQIENEVQEIRASLQEEFQASTDSTGDDCTVKAAKGETTVSAGV